jgi:hypothetical protein
MEESEEGGVEVWGDPNKEKMNKDLWSLFMFSLQLYAIMSQIMITQILVDGKGRLGHLFYNSLVILVKIIFTSRQQSINQIL